MYIDTSLIILLIAIILIDIQAYYFGFINPPKATAWLQKSGFITLTFLLIPVLIYTIYHQAGSVKRLEAYGLDVYPAIDNAVGFNNGYGKNPTWVFELTDKAQDVLSFYKQSLSDMRWILIEDNHLYLRYKQKEKLLTIGHQKSPGKDTLTIMIKTEL